MKKIVGIIAAAALAASAFAEVSVGSWNRQDYVPLAYNGTDLVHGGMVNWDMWRGANPGVNQGRIGIGFNANADDVAGLSADLHGNNGQFELGDNAYIWVKPFNFMKISMGKIENNWKRGNLCYGFFDHTIRIGGGRIGEDLTFQKKDANFSVLLTPVEGLEIDYSVSTTSGGTYFYNSVWNQARFGVAYAIDGVGTIKAQIRGKDNATNKDGDKVAWGVANVAFDLTSVENLFLTVGAYAPTTFAALGSDNKQDGDSTVKVALGVNYKLDALTLHAFADTRLLVADVESANPLKDANKFGFAFGAGVDFAITDAYTLIADVRYNDAWYNTVGNDKKAKDCLAFYAGIAHQISNATLDIGFEGSTNSVGCYVDPSKADAFTFAIPLQVTVGF